MFDIIIEEYKDRTTTELLHEILRQLFFIKQQNDKIMSTNAEVLAELQTIKDGIADIAASDAAEVTALEAVASEINDLKNGGSVSTDVQASLDDLAAKVTAAAATRKANAAALAALAPAPAAPVTSDPGTTSGDAGTPAVGSDQPAS